ncbi:SGNH/GDSL hydrolase family protein [Rhizobium leguminosarum]
MGNPLEFRDNLAAFYGAVVRARETGQTINIHIVGDSKVAGTGVSAAYTLDKLLGAAAKGYPVNVTYDGFGGQNSWLWANGKAGDFVAAHANASLLIVDFGTNENVLSADGGAQTLAQTKANHLAAIATIRASLSRSQLSILLLGQTPANNWKPAYNQTTEAMEGVNAVLSEVAQETNSGYFDTLQILHRAHSEAGWMEQLPTPTYGDGNVHPGDAMNLVLMGELAQGLFPIPYAPVVGSTGVAYPALANNWKAWTAPATGYAPRALLRDGVVFLDGLIKPGTISDYTTVFTLPPGYRPNINRFFTVSTSNNGAAKQIQILSGGEVRLGEGFSGSYLSLDGISFRVD